MTASGSEQTVTLPKLLRISGKVTDRAGRPIKGVTAIPVLEFRPGHLLVERSEAKGPFDGTYSIEVDRTDVSYRTRVEAPGYRSAMSEVAKAGMPNPTFDFQLEAAPPVLGRLVGRAASPSKMRACTWPRTRRISTTGQTGTGPAQAIRRSSPMRAVAFRCPPSLNRTLWWSSMTAVTPRLISSPASSRAS